MMQLIALDAIDIWVWSFQFGFLNHLKGAIMNVLTFFYAKLDNVVEDYQKSKGNDLHHQGLILMVFKHIMVQMGIFEIFNRSTLEGILVLGSLKGKHQPSIEKKH